MRTTYYKLLEELKNTFRRHHKTKVVVGLSGGLDSAVALKLCSDALGHKNCTALILPEQGLTKTQNTKDAESFAKKVRVKHFVVDISPLLSSFSSIGWKQSKVALMNTKARIRANLLFNYADSNNALVAGASTKSKLMLGYGIPHGDFAADIYPLGGLLKTEVIELAKFMKIPDSILRKKPSPELTVGQSAEVDLGATYSKLDGILRKVLLEEKLNRKDYLIKRTLLRVEKHRRRFETTQVLDVE